MAITLSVAKQHCKIDYDDEDDLLEIYMAAAVAYMGQYCPYVNDGNAPAHYDVALLMLIGHYYKHREITTNGTVNSVPLGFEMILRSLRPAFLATRPTANT